MTRIDCEDALEKLAEFLDHELSTEEKKQVAEHLDACKSCFSRAEFERRLKTKLAELGQTAAPASMQARIRKILSTF